MVETHDLTPQEFMEKINEFLESVGQPYRITLPEAQFFVSGGWTVKMFIHDILSDN